MASIRKKKKNLDRTTIWPFLGICFQRNSNHYVSWRQHSLSNYCSQTPQYGAELGVCECTSKLHRVRNCWVSGRGSPVICSGLAMWDKLLTEGQTPAPSSWGLWQSWATEAQRTVGATRAGCGEGDTAGTWDVTKLHTDRSNRLWGQSLTWWQ